MGGEIDRPKAKKLTPDQVSLKRKEAFELETLIKRILELARGAEWALAEVLYKFDEAEGWRWVGYEHISEFLAQPEIGMQKSKYYAYTQMWRDLVIAGRVSTRAETLDGGVEVTRVPELEGTSPRKVYEVLPAIRKGDVPVKEALSDAKSLGARDLRQQYRQENASKLKLDASQEPERCRCPTCRTYVFIDQLEGEWELVDGELREVTDDDAANDE